MNNNNLPQINSHNSWSPLEEVWLGDVYPASWYDHLRPEIRDVFHHLTEITQEDLYSIQEVIESFGVVVQRPTYERIDDYLINGNLIKPQICPRDQFVVAGNTLWCDPHHMLPWNHIIDIYRQNPRSNININRNGCINGANVVRVGRDIVIDRDIFNFEYQDIFPEYRVHLVDNGGHMDGCFAILKPGLIIANNYWDGYEKTFPGWEIIRLDDPVYRCAPSTGYHQSYPVYNGKFWDTTVGSNQSFNQHIIDHALDWVGMYTETYFELNCLVIDTENVIMLSENAMIEKKLRSHGITVHWVPFRARSFWDGAVHCLTLDICRDSSIEDFFPERKQ